MSASRRFPHRTVAAARDGKILGLRAGHGTHRFIGVWVVVVEGRVFVRSWGVKPGGWYRTFLQEPYGTIQIGNRSLRVRAMRTRSERLKDAVSAAYRAKYHTPGAVRYVRDLCRPRCRAATIELIPQPSPSRRA